MYAAVGAGLATSVSELGTATRREATFEIAVERVVERLVEQHP